MPARNCITATRFGEEEPGEAGEEKLQVAFASSSTVQDCINLALYRLYSSPFLFSTHPPCALNPPFLFVLSAARPCCSFQRSFNADRETDVHRYCVGLALFSAYKRIYYLRCAPTQRYLTISDVTLFAKTIDVFESTCRTFKSGFCGVCSSHSQNRFSANRVETKKKEKNNSALKTSKTGIINGEELRGVRFFSEIAQKKVYNSDCKILSRR